MSHTLIALIVKAQNETEAEEKAEHAIYDMMFYEQIGIDNNPIDWGVVLNSKSNPQDHSCSIFRTSHVNSKNGQGFIKHSLPSKITKEAVEAYAQSTLSGQYNLEAAKKMLKEERKLANKGFFVRDEQGQYMRENDRRLYDDNYFVVPIDVHS